MTRKILIGIAVLVALVVAGAGALLLFIDINRFKPQIEQAAQQRLQWRLSIEGDLSLSVFPRVTVVGSLTGQDGRTLTELRGATIPVRLSGPFDQLSCHIDWGGVARDALKGLLGR